MEKTLKIPENAKVRVYWDDKSENYNKQEKSKIINYFSEKYNINKKNVNVIFRPIKINDNGEVVKITGSSLENVMDINYQRQLFKQWLDREQKDIDFNKIIELDNIVNSEVKINITDLRLRKYSLKWVKINNFLCFGDIEPVYYDDLKGLICVTSQPKNMGGKTTFSIDVPLFLFYGETSKTDKNEEIFNTYSDKNDLVIKGCVDIEGVDYVIERLMSRKQTKKGEWTVSNTLNYYQYMPDGEELPLVGEDATRTTKIISDTIGTKEDFMLTVLATGKNLEDIIDTTPTEKSKLFSRFLGLDILDEKDVIVRKIYNTYSKTMKSNLYNIPTLNTEIENLKSNNLELDENIKTSDITLTEYIEKIKLLEKQKDNLLEKKEKIDINILKLSPERLANDIKTTTEKGKDLAKTLESLKEQISKLKDVMFDETKHNGYLQERREKEKVVDQTENKIKTNEKTSKQLKESELCPTCKRPLEGVDNTKEIDRLLKEVETNKGLLITLNKELSTINDTIKKSEEIQKEYNNKSKLELQRDRIDVDITSLRTDLRGFINDKKTYDDNINGIEKNKKIESDILGVKSQIQMNTIEKDKIISNIQKFKSNIEQNLKDIKTKEELITIINKEMEEEKVYKIYMDLVGKKGVSKIVLKSVLPIINSELHRILDEVVDFDVEVMVNSKNDIEFYLLRDGVYKKLKSGSGLEKTASALSLRFILSQVSSLPKPNFIAFDEIFGMVADENYEPIRLLFDKCTDMFETIFIISHEDIIKDWGDKIITVEKNNNISKLTIV